MYWIAAAANTRRTGRSLHLAVEWLEWNAPQHKLRGDQIIVPAEYYQTTAGGTRGVWQIPLDKINEIHDPDIPRVAPIVYNGPHVQYRGFVHDVWRVAGAALDIIMANIDECAGVTKGDEASAKPPLPPEPPKPQWNDGLRELSFGGAVCKRYKQPAPHQTTILKVFQETGWPAKIDDPLPYTSESKRRDRLTNAVKKLNEQSPPLLRFELDGTGQGILWRRATPPSA